MVEHPLDPFFVPDSIAIIGASRDPRKLGYVILDNLQRGGFTGEIFAVNPKAESVLGVTTFQRLTELARPVDLAVIVVPASCVPDVIDDCVASGVRAALVITAGFREIGEEGALRERDIVARAQRSGLRIVGPNSVGIINTFSGLNVTFAETQPLRHNVALISQSGAVATAILDWARSLGVGFSKFVSLGNRSDVSESELIDYLASDPETDQMVLYLEGFSDGKLFMEACRRVTAIKPVVVMKVGRSTAGARAALSHTGSLASSDAVVDAALRQTGVTRAYTLDELFDLTLTFSCAPLPLGPRVAVITNAGGPGVMAADAIECSDLELASLTDASLKALKVVLPATASIQNPIDLLGDARSSRFQQVTEIVLQDPQVDAVVVMLTPQAVTEPELTARALVHLARVQAKPLLVVYMGGEAVNRGRVMLDNASVPAFAYPERAVRSLNSLWIRTRFLNNL